MSYNLTLSNGTALLTLADGQADTATTSLSLIGRNYAGYGLFLNENFIKLLENFSGTTEPVKPLVGQLWWDSNNKQVKVWLGSSWKNVNGSQTGVTAPTNPNEGDIWWNTTASQLSAYNGTQWVAVGPVSPPGSAVTTITGNAVSDGTTTHLVGNVIVNNKLTAIFSSDSTSFVPVGSAYSTINPGLNLLTGVTVGGNLVASNAIFSGNVTFTGNVATPSPGVFSANVVPTANLTYNLGSPTVWWNNIYGTSIHAQYADLAERFEADTSYDPGTVVELGGAAEITAVVEELSEDVFGVISSKAAFVMNGTAGPDSTHPPVAVQGRVPVKVIGKVRKGQRLVSAGNGLARAGTKQELTTWNVIGRSLENKTTDGEGMIEAVVKLNS